MKKAQTIYYWVKLDDQFDSKTVLGMSIPRFPYSVFLFFPNLEYRPLISQINSIPFQDTVKKYPVLKNSFHWYKRGFRCRAISKEEFEVEIIKLRLK